MKRGRIQFLAVLCFATAIGVANGSWYDDYAEGIKAAKTGQWAKVLSSMTKAIGGNNKESNNARTYGAIFINYKPYYYRGVANLNLGKYEQAIADLEKTMGPGEIDLGPIEVNLKRAKDGLVVPETTTTVAPPPPPPPIDPLLRRNAETAVSQALDSLEAAQQRNAAGTTEYRDAMTQYREASKRLNSVTSNDDLRTVIRVAGDAVRLANLAIVIPPPPPPPPTDTTKTAIVVDDVLGQTRRNLRLALVSYFEGDFVAAETKFKGLSRDLPNNPWIWAFLGASQWSRYAFETEDQLRLEAIKSFKKARQYGWKGGLPQKYFSRRIRNAFERTAG
jgi:tetratricopeptide (TPR) repeat protein